MARPRKFVEADVMDAVRNQFWSRGYAATSVDELTEATGLGKGSLYGAFGDKHSLFIRTLDEYCASTTEKIIAQLRAPGLSAYDRLAGHVRATAADIVADRERRGCLMANSSAELAAADTDVRRVVDRSLAAWHKELVTCIAAAQQEGTIAAQRDPQVLATVLLAAMRGLGVIHQGGMKPAQISSAAEEILALVHA